MPLYYTIKITDFRCGFVNDILNDEIGKIIIIVIFPTAYEYTQKATKTRPIFHSQSRNTGNEFSELIMLSHRFDLLMR